jgi:hypothetical protein
MKAFAYAALLALVVPTHGFAQTPTTTSDADLIKLALSAAPEAIAKDATVIAMDADHKVRTLRQGSGQWTMHARPR